MKLKHPVVNRGLALLASWALRGWMRTMRTRLDFSRWDHVHPADPKKNRFIYAYWHESAVLPLLFAAKAHVLISNHSDGGLIANVCEFLKLGTIRGSTNRGGIAALKEMLRVARKGHIVVTPDGPRGPRRVVQSGVIYLASRTGLPILPVGTAGSSVWRAKSWDRFMVPRPFSTVYAVGDTPLVVPPALDPRGIEDYRLQLEQRMLRSTEDAENWATGQGRIPRSKQAPDMDVGLRRVA